MRMFVRIANGNATAATCSRAPWGLESRSKSKSSVSPVTLGHIDFWKDFKNHAETKRLLEKHNLLAKRNKFDAHVNAVAKCWMTLSNIHLKEAKKATSSALRRSFYSRSYYAVYNASKSIRYLVKGEVSGTGDDHKHVSDLPNDFPDVEKWGEFLRDMYKFRLIADYDGWPNSIRELSRKTAPALDKCGEFIRAAKKYALHKYGVRL